MEALKMDYYPTCHLCQSFTRTDKRRRCIRRNKEFTNTMLFAKCKNLKLAINSK